MGLVPLFSSILILPCYQISAPGNGVLPNGSFPIPECILIATPKTLHENSARNVCSREAGRRKKP